MPWATRDRRSWSSPAPRQASPAGSRRSQQSEPPVWPAGSRVSPFVAARPPGPSGLRPNLTDHTEWMQGTGTDNPHGRVRISLARSRENPLAPPQRVRRDSPRAHRPARRAADTAFRSFGRLRVSEDAAQRRGERLDPRGGLRHREGRRPRGRHRHLAQRQRPRAHGLRDRRQLGPRSASARAASSRTASPPPGSPPTTARCTPSCGRRSTFTGCCSIRRTTSPCPDNRTS